MAEYAPTVPRFTESVFLVLAWDGDNSAPTRDSELEGHLHYVEKQVDRYLVCGPLRDPGGAELIGSFFLVAAESADEAKALVSEDPYIKSGMYREVVVKEAIPAGGRLMGGGVIWESAEAVRAAQG